MFTYSRLLDVYYITPENLRTLETVAVVGAFALAVFVIAGIYELVRGFINFPKEKKAAEELNELRLIKENYNYLRGVVLARPELYSGIVGVFSMDGNVTEK